jgi:soluble lytic murein transglycosylase
VKLLTENNRRFSRINQKKRRNPYKTLAKALIVVVLLILIISLYSRIPEWRYPLKYADTIATESAANDIDPYLICAVIHGESDFDENAVSAAGACGLMQLMPDTAAWIAEKNNEAFDPEKLSEPEYNIRLGCKYMAYLLEYWDNDLPKAIASYNGGLTTVESWLADGVWDGTLADADQIPYPETRTYLERILQSYDYYQRIYADYDKFMEIEWTLGGDYE